MRVGIDCDPAMIDHARQNLQG
jgi:16S rRNA (cytosine1402-N4)-methyltransferase